MNGQRLFKGLLGVVMVDLQDDGATYTYLSSPFQRPMLNMNVTRDVHVKTKNTS
jgi:hypothetical protein